MVLNAPRKVEDKVKKEKSLGQREDDGRVCIGGHRKASRAKTYQDVQQVVVEVSWEHATPQEQGPGLEVVCSQQVEAMD